MKSQADGAWQLYRAFGDINDKYIIESIQDIDFQSETKLQPVKSKRKVISLLPRVLLVAALLALPASAIGDSSLFDVAKAKTAAIDLTDAELQEVCDSLAAQHITPGILTQLEPLQINENGLVYGFDSSITDLVITPTDDGRFGYAYRMAFFGNVDDPPDVKYYKLTHTRKMPVYKEDGKTLIGYFTCGWSWPPETPHIGMM